MSRRLNYSVGVFLLCAIFAGNCSRGSAQIAPGVQQSAARTASVVGTVVQESGALIPNAGVQLIGPAILDTKSDEHGLFEFSSVPYGTYRIIVTSMNLGIMSRDNVVVNGDVEVTIQYSTPSEGLKTIARVSTKSVGAQINVTPASVASVNPSEYAFQGNNSWQHLLNQIPGVTVGGGLEGGNSTVDTIPDSPFQPIVLSINGALPYETSTTLDGMPLQNTSIGVAYGNGVGSGVDISYLPMAIFDTADIVRGPGANAPSIVNSIGGSFVLHAPDKIDKNSAEFSVSNDAYGGIFANGKLAWHIGRFSTVITYGINTSPGPLGNQSVITGYAWKPTTVNGQPFQSGGVAGFSPSANPIYGSNCFCQLQDTLLYCCVPLNSAWTQHSGAIALSYNLAPSVTAQAFYAGSSSVMRRPFLGYSVNFIPGSGYTGSITPGVYNYTESFDAPSNSQAASLLEEKITAYEGRGVLRLAALQNDSFFSESIPYREPNGQYTLYGSGYFASAPTTPVNFNGVAANLTFPTFTSNRTYWVNNRDLMMSYATQLGSSSNAGISYVTSYYNEPSQAQTLNGTVSSFQSTPSSVSETTGELRINASTEISDHLMFDASWYFARGSYHVQNPNDATGNTYVDATFPYSAPRLSALWRVTQNVVIRAAAGGGYALPPLPYLAPSNQAYFCGPFYYEFGTNLNLKPEQSFGFDLGSDVRFHQNTVLSFDFYRVNLFGQFFQSTTQEGTYNGLPLYVSEYGNLSHSLFEGLNIDVRRDVPRGVYWHGALGLTRAYVVSVPAGFYDDPSVPCTNCINTYIVPGINFNGEFQSTVPYANGSAQIGYRWNSEKYIDLSPTYYGNGNPYFQKAFVEFDAHMSYPLARNVSLLATLKNISGIYGQNYEYVSPSSILGAPTIAGGPNPLFGIPYGPRSLVVTVNVR